jgi:hypothetical protein
LARVALPDALTQIAEAQRAAMEDLARAVSNGVPVDAWFDAMQHQIKRAHIQAAVIGRGDRAAMTQADWGRVGARLREEYGFLRQFGQEIAEGNLSAAQITARAQQYANHTQMSYWDANRAGQTATQERRVLNPGETCPDCERFAGMGWQPIGTLPPPGVDSECRSNCNCSMEFR